MCELSQSPKIETNNARAFEGEAAFDARIERFVAVEMADNLPISFEELELVET